MTSARLQGGCRFSVLLFLDDLDDDLLLDRRLLRFAGLPHSSEKFAPARCSSLSAGTTIPDIETSICALAVC